MFQMSLIKLVTFDFTNTIGRVLGGVGYQYATIAKIYGVQVDVDKLNASFPVMWKEQNTKYPNFGQMQAVSSYKWWADMVKGCFHLAGCTENDDKLSPISRHLYAHFKTAAAWEVSPDVRPTLESLQKSGLKLGIISNFDERLDQVLTSLALIHYFDFVFTSMREQLCKPDPRIFQRALLHAKVDPSDALHVGDNFELDYSVARAVGMKAVLHVKGDNPSPDGVDPEWVVRNVSEVLEFIEKCKH
jgi:REG-2-like HAD superfamily hydrolase